MKRVYGTNVEVSRDSTGGFVSVDWTCPYCGEFHAGFHFFPALSQITGDFEIDEPCDYCGKEVTIICANATELL